MKNTTETDAVNLKLKQEIGYPGVVGLAGRVIGLANDRGAGAGGAAMTTTCQIKGPDCREPRDELGVTACEQCGLLGCATCVPDHDEHATELLCPRCESAAEDLDLDGLDPGFRDVVEALLRLKSTDSGDGVSKAQSGPPVTQYADPSTGVLAAAQAIQALYATSSAGGALHVVVDDNNVDRLPSREWIEGLFFDEDESEERAATLAVWDALEPLPPCHRMAAITLREELDGRRKDGPVGPSRFCRIVDDYDLGAHCQDVDRAYDALESARRQLSGAPAWPAGGYPGQRDPAPPDDLRDSEMAQDAMAVWSAIRVALDNDGRIEDIETVHRLAWSVTAAAARHARGEAE